MHAKDECLESACRKFMERSARRIATDRVAIMAEGSAKEQCKKDLLAEADVVFPEQPGPGLYEWGRGATTRPSSTKMRMPEPPATVPGAARACWAVVQKMLQTSALVRERTARPLGDPVGHLTPGAWTSTANDGLNQDRQMISNSFFRNSKRGDV